MTREQLFLILEMHRTIHNMTNARFPNRVSSWGIWWYFWWWEIQIMKFAIILQCTKNLKT